MKKFLILIDGPMGSGKTTLGKLLHPHLPRTAMLSTDAIKFFISDFERGTRDNTISASVLRQMCREYLRHNINILLPQGLWRKSYVEPYQQLAQELGVDFFIYQLTAPREVLLGRIHNRPKPQLAKTPVPEDRIQRNLDTWEENHYELGTVFDTTEFAPEEIAKRILTDLEEHGVSVTEGLTKS